jgi:hypothetical protein
LILERFQWMERPRLKAGPGFKKAGAFALSGSIYGLPLTKPEQRPPPPLDHRTKKEQCSLYVLKNEGEATMLRIFVEEAAALTSIALFVGMIAVWAQLISQF